MAQVKEKKPETPEKKTWRDRIRVNLHGAFRRSPYALDDAETAPDAPDAPEKTAANPFALSDEEQQAAAQAEIAAQPAAPRRKKGLASENPFLLSDEERQAAERAECAADTDAAPAAPDAEAAQPAEAVSANELKKHHKRRWYGIPVGTLVLCFALVGVGWTAVRGVRYVHDRLTDDSAERSYDNYLNAVVMLDPEPFESVSAADPAMMQQAAVWKTVFDHISTLNQYDDQARLVVPGEMVRESLVELFGVDAMITAGSFEVPGGGDTVQVDYDADADSYHTPIPDTVGTYRPYTVSIHKRGGYTLLRVAYCVSVDSTSSAVEAEMVTNDLAVVKYMEYQLSFDNDTKLSYISAIRALSN